MDSLITIVVIAAAIIFKVVSKKLSTAAGDEVFPAVPVEPDVMNGPVQLENDQPVEVPVSRPEPMVMTSVYEEVQRAVPVKKEVRKVQSVKKPSTSVLKKDASKKKEKIDPKKLIVYSEIMKPKYLE